MVGLELYRTFSLLSRKKSRFLRLFLYILTGLVTGRIKKESVMFLGIPDVSVWVAFLLMFLVTGAAVVYGIVMWNKGDNRDPEEEQEKKKWVEEEIALEEKVDGGVS